MNTTWLTVLVLCSVLRDALTFNSGPSTLPKPSGSDIAAQAEKHINSTEWSYSGCRHPGCNKWKCHTFVAEMIVAAGATSPHRHLSTWSPIEAYEWANTTSTYLTGDSHWTLVTSPKRGDISGYGVHVGIVRYSNTTISAAKVMILSNDWGFRNGQSPTFWRYKVKVVSDSVRVDGRRYAGFGFSEGSSQYASFGSGKP